MYRDLDLHVGPARNPILPAVEYWYELSELTCRSTTQNSSTRSRSRSTCTSGRSTIVTAFLPADASKISHLDLLLYDNMCNIPRTYNDLLVVLKIPLDWGWDRTYENQRAKKHNAFQHVYKRWDRGTCCSNGYYLTRREYFCQEKVTIIISKFAKECEPYNICTEQIEQQRPNTYLLAWVCLAAAIAWRAAG